MNKYLQYMLLALIVLAVGCEKENNFPKPSGKTVKIGVIAPISGPDKESGENALLGIQTALKMKPYLENGDKVELIIEDNKGNPEQTLSALEKLYADDEVAGVLLMAKSDAVLTIAPIADKYKIPMVALVATHPDITKDNRFITQLGFDDIYQGTIAALYTRDELLIDKVAVFRDPDDAHYSFLADEFIRKFTSVGGEVVEKITTETEMEELQDIMERLKQNDIQMLYFAVTPERFIQIIKIADKMSWEPKMMGSDGLLSSIFLEHSKDMKLANTMMATDFYSTTLPKTEYGQKAVQLFNKLFSEPGTFFTGLACEGTSIMLHAMERCGNMIDRSCVNTMLRNTNEFQGIFGKISIREDGKTERPIFVNVLDDQEIKFLVKVY